MDVHDPNAPRALEVTPVVVDGVMYVTTVNEAWALDARNGREIWHYAARAARVWREMRPADQPGRRGARRPRVHGVGQCAPVRASPPPGQLVWDVEMADSHQNYGSTGAPWSLTTW